MPRRAEDGAAAAIWAQPSSIPLASGELPLLRLVLMLGRRPLSDSAAEVEDFCRTVPVPGSS